MPIQNNGTLASAARSTRHGRLRPFPIGTVAAMLAASLLLGGCDSGVVEPFGSDARPAEDPKEMEIELQYDPVTETLRPVAASAAVQGSQLVVRAGFCQNCGTGIPGTKIIYLVLENTGTTSIQITGASGRCLYNCSVAAFSYTPSPLPVTLGPGQTFFATLAVVPTPDVIQFKVRIMVTFVFP